MPDTIYARPDHYDLEHEGDDLDIRFYRALLERYRPSRLLELGCGSGRITLPLAEAAAARGPEVVGVDLDERMLAQARAKAGKLDAAARARVSLVQGDLRDWPAPVPFDLVIVPCSTIGHVLSLHDQLATWRRAWHNLSPGGRFAVEITMPDLATYAESMQHPPRALVEMDIDSESPAKGSRLIRYRAVRYLPHLQRARIHFLYDAFAASEAADRFVSDFESHVYFPRELQLLFLATGFEIEHAWADYRFEPPQATSRQLVMVGRKPEGARAEIATEGESHPKW